MEGHAKKNVWSDIASWPTKQTQQLYKVTTPCLDDHQFQEERIGICWRIVKSMLSNCSEMSVLGSIGRPDTLWSADKLARTVTKWTRACDKRLARLIYHLHHTSDFKQYHHVGNTAQQCSLGLFQDSDFAGDLEDSKSISGRMLCIFGSHTFVPTSWMCKKQTSVSHSSTESEITSLDAGLRMDGIPALESSGFGFWSVAFFFQPTWEIPRESAGRLAAWHTIKETHQQPSSDSNSAQRSWIIQRRFCFLKREVFPTWCDALHFWR